MKKAFIILATAVMASACSFLDPLENGAYTEENVDKYPNFVRGYINTAYGALAKNYLGAEYMYADAAADNAAFRTNTSMQQFATGSAQMSSYPFSSLWDNSYNSIFYCNCFLKDNLGLNTRYYVDQKSDKVLRRTLQGDAYGLRAYYYFRLLKCFGGMGNDGKLLGVPLYTEPVSGEDAGDYKPFRSSYDDCAKQILDDCDSALLYLPLANRDFLRETDETAIVTGSIRYKNLDQVGIHALKAFVYLTWASPAFNPSGDMSRYKFAAQEAKWVIDHKLQREYYEDHTGGFNPKTAFLWTNPNDPEIIFLSQTFSNSDYEKALYPYNFGGTSTLGPTQELVDAFPMANGYPITDPASGYNPDDPYSGRDPRFYSSVFYDKANIVRNKNNEVMYTFAIADGGRDAIGGQTTSPTGYYVKKLLYSGWNASDTSIETAAKAVYFFRWTQMCLIFAEAANLFTGDPNDESVFKLSAKQALSFLRARNTDAGMAGVGAETDPYLDKCAASSSEFDNLVRNEWRIETCFEGNRFFDLRRWGLLDEINKPVHGVVINNGKYSTVEVEKRQYPSLWLPIPYLEIRKSSDTMVQNEGWENYK